MDFKYKQLEHELSALSRVFGELGVRLSEVAKDVTSPGVTPPDKLIEQISTARTNFDNVRTAVHGHAATMLVSPLPKIGEVVSITAVDTLLKASAAAEENKLSIESERDRALSILSRVLAITHKEAADFKPLQECYAKVDELRNGISKIAWPHRHPEAEIVNGSKHPYTALLSFVENLDTLEDDRWIALETTITETFGKPLFVAASRGKLVVPKATAAEKPAAAAPAPAPTAEKKVVADKAPEKPAAPATPAAHVDRKVPSPTPAPAPVAAVPPKPAAPVVAAEKKDTVEKPQPVAAPQPVPAPTPAAAPATVNATPAPAPVAPAAIAPTPTPTAPVAPAQVIAATSTTPAPTMPAPTVPVAAAPAPTPQRPPSPASAPAVANIPTPAAVVPAAPAPAPSPVATAPAAVSNGPAPVAAAPTATPAASSAPVVPAAPVAATPQTNLPSLTALATATEPAPERKVVTPVETIDKQRKEPRLAAPVPQPVAKSEPKPQEAEMVAEQQAGDGSGRPQRWGFWRGNR